jgi:hypothetical protein
LNLRVDGRENAQLRSVKITRNYMPYAEGSALIEVGGTRVICTASVEEAVPPFKKNSGEGWVTAEYAMLPRATRTRSQRDIGKLRLNGRSQEIQRAHRQVAEIRSGSCAAGREADFNRLRRYSGGRRNKDGFHNGSVRSSCRCVRISEAEGADPGHTGFRLFGCCKRRNSGGK